MTPAGHRIRSFAGAPRWLPAILAVRALALALAIGGLTLLAATGASAQAQDALPPVGVVLTLEVRDHEAWLAVFQDVLATPTSSTKPLVLTTRAITPPRSIILLTPKFSVFVNTARAPQALRVTVRATVAGTEAATTLPSFVSSLFETGSHPHPVRLDYGLSQVNADLLEVLTVDR